MHDSKCKSDNHFQIYIQTGKSDIKRTYTPLTDKPALDVWFKQFLFQYTIFTDMKQDLTVSRSQSLSHLLTSQCSFDVGLSF